MSLGVNPENFAIMVILLLAVLPGAILWLSIGGLLMRLARIQNIFLAVPFIALMFIGPLIGASLYLDSAGTVVKAQVQKRTEQIHYRQEGDWTHEYTVQVQYTVPSELPSSAQFSTNAVTFDKLSEGEFIDVRAVDVNHWFSYMRLADQSTLTWLRWDWLGIGLAVVLGGWLLWQLSKRTRWGWVLAVCIALALCLIPLVNKLWEGERSQDPSLTPLRAAGIVQAVERVTAIDPLPARNAGGGERWETEIQVPQPYDIVVVRYTPQGYEQPVLGVDAVDADSVIVKQDQPVEIAYAASEPRTVRFLPASRSHYWKNPLRWVGEQLGAMLIIALLIIGAGWLGDFAKRWLDARLKPQLPR